MAAEPAKVIYGPRFNPLDSGTPCYPDVYIKYISEDWNKVRIATSCASELGYVLPPGDYTVIKNGGNIGVTSGELPDDETLYIQRDADKKKFKLVYGETLTFEVIYLIEDNEGLEEVCFNRRRCDSW